LTQKRLPSLRRRAFRLEPALARGCGKGPLRQAGGPVLLGEEYREVAAEDFLFLIALEAPRAGVPAGDRSVRLQHVDGIVGDRVDQQLEALIHHMDLEAGLVLDSHRASP